MSLFIEKIYNGNNKFTDYPYELSDFQKISVEAIDNDNNVLVCAPTASGKTLVAEHLIQKYSKLNQNNWPSTKHIRSFTIACHSRT